MILILISKRFNTNYYRYDNYKVRFIQYLLLLYRSTFAFCISIHIILQFMYINASALIATLHQKIFLLMFVTNLKLILFKQNILKIYFYIIFYYLNTFIPKFEIKIFLKDKLK